MPWSFYGLMMEPYGFRVFGLRLSGRLLQVQFARQISGVFEGQPDCPQRDSGDAAHESKMIDTSVLSKGDKELCREVFEMLSVPPAEISSIRPRLAKFDIDQACLWFAIGTMMKMQGLNEAWGDLATVLRAAGNTDESDEAEKKFLELGGSRDEKLLTEAYSIVLIARTAL